jgi:hypothetical protein
MSPNPDHLQIPSGDPQANETAESLFPSKCGQEETIQRIEVPAKPGARPRPGSVQDQTSDSRAESRDSDNENRNPSMEWRRKATNRRLRANRIAGESGRAVDAGEYAPEFVPLRMPDWTPGFDQPAVEPASGTRNPAPVERNPMNDRWRWLVSAGAVLAILLVAGHGLLLWNQDDFERERRESQAASRSLYGAAPPNAVESMLETVPRVRALLERFFAATKVEDKVPCVRGGAALLPAMREWYASHADEPTLLTMARDVMFASRDGREFIIATGTDAERNSFEAVVERSPDGLRLDWRYLTGAGEMEWQQWIDERTRRPVLQRVFVALDDYYAGQFGDPGSWVCIKVTDLSHSTTVWAYAERGSSVASELLRKVSGSRKPIRLCAHFEFPAGPLSPLSPSVLAPQVFLRSVAESGWIDCSPEAAGERNSGPR